LSEVEAIAEERQQLFRRTEAELSTGINLFDPTGESLLPRLSLSSELQNKRPSHHY
jgi:hypothetical protein